MGAVHYLKVGELPVRGPLQRRAIEQSFRSGVIDADCLVGDSPDGPWRALQAFLAEPTPASGGVRVAALLGGALVVLSVAAVATVAAVKHFRRTSICPATTRVVGEMKGQLLIEFYVTRATPQMTRFADEVGDLLRRYEKEGAGKVRVAVIDVPDAESRRKAREAGLQETVFSESNGAADAPRSLGCSGVVFTLGAEKGVIPLLSPDRTDGLEFWFTSKIRELRARSEGRVYRIGLLAGHGEAGFRQPDLVAPTPGAGQPTLQKVLEQNFPFYRFTDVDLRGGTGDVDGALDGLIIMQPSSDLSEPELRAVDRFLLKGKGLAVFASAVNVKPGDNQLSATLSSHGLERLLDGYGVTMAPAVVVSRTPSQVPTQTGSLQLAAIPRVTEAQIDSRFPVTFRIDELVLPFASPLTLHPEKQPGAKLYPVVRTGQEAYAVSAGPLQLGPSWAPVRQGTAADMVVAAAVSGTIRSAFGQERSSAPARVLVFSSSQFLSNPFARAVHDPAAPPATTFGSSADPVLMELAGYYAQRNLTSSILVAKNSLDWMAGDADLAACGLLPSE